jgi:ParB-like chromosome segregation protein Spo0J
MDNPEKRSYEHVKISDLQAAPRNARTHSKRQIDQIANSIRRFGFTNPILIDDARVIIAGHGRVAAAKDVGLTDVPCVLLSRIVFALAG